MQFRRRNYAKIVFSFGNGVSMHKASHIRLVLVPLKSQQPKSNEYWEIIWRNEEWRGSQSNVAYSVTADPENSEKVLTLNVGCTRRGSNW